MTLSALPLAIGHRPSTDRASACVMVRAPARLLPHSPPGAWRCPCLPCVCLMCERQRARRPHQMLVKNPDSADSAYLLTPGCPSTEQGVHARMNILAHTAAPRAPAARRTAAGAPPPPSNSPHRDSPGPAMRARLHGGHVLGGRHAVVVEAQPLLHLLLHALAEDRGRHVLEAVDPGARTVRIRVGIAA